MVVMVDEDGRLCLYETSEQALAKLSLDAGFDLDKCTFYNQNGQRLVLKDINSESRLVPHGRPDKKNLCSIIEKADAILVNEVDGIKSKEAIKKALSC